MSNFGGKYFEEIIARLIKAKNAENYQMRREFKNDLRKRLIEDASLTEVPVEEGFDLGAFWAKWKYALGAVPTMAVLAVVAINALDQKVVMNQPEQTFQSTIQQKNSEAPEINSMVMSEMADVEITENEGIKTFPGYLAMPSEEALKNFRKAEDGVMNLPMMDSNLTELKIDDPQSQLNKVSFGESELLPPAERTEVERIELPANAVFVMEVPVQENVQEEELLEDVATQDDVMQSEQFQAGMGGGVSESIDQATSLDVGNALLVDSLSVEEVKADVEKENALRQLNDQQNVLLNQEIPVEQNGDLAVVDYRFNVMDEYNQPSQYRPEINLNQQVWFNNNALMQDSRIYYEGEKYQLLKAFVNNEIVSRSGLLSGDYYYEGQDLEPGVIKLTLWEFGQKAKIYILKEEPYGLRVVTEVDF
jgi:hypothetical protein